ncbi:hypothetical protein L1887_00840 [Cichorium endivia]|nr:hypothetical protein L1887_00840 [Cichorium endivia]
MLTRQYRVTKKDFQYPHFNDCFQANFIISSSAVFGPRFSIRSIFDEKNVVSLHPYLRLSDTIRYELTKSNSRTQNSISDRKSSDRQRLAIPSSVFSWIRGSISTGKKLRFYIRFSSFDFNLPSVLISDSPIGIC